MSERLGKSFWEKAGAASDFNAEWKEKIFKFIKKELKKQNISIGETILDLGSGINPVSRFIADKDSNVIYVDFNAPKAEHRGEHSFHIPRDITELIKPNSFAEKRSIIESSKVLGADPRTEHPKQIDTIIISDLLNYVSATSLLERANHYLKPEGIIIVLNQPGRTFEQTPQALDPQGATSNEIITKTLSELRLDPIYETTTNDNYYIGVYQKPIDTLAEKDLA